MSEKYTKLKNQLLTLFQLDQPELDFGIYRIMHLKKDDVVSFLEDDLPPQVAEAFAQYRSADKGELQKQLDEQIANAQNLGFDPDQSSTVSKLKAQLADSSMDVDGLEGEVYDHLSRFFSRYYSEGDFISKRVYKNGVYALPYQGEEVKFSWANEDQYYIKTSETLRNYSFRLRPDDEENPMRVNFAIADAAEGEHANVKASESTTRFFALASEDFIEEIDNELVIRFEYRQSTKNDWPDADQDAKKEGPKQAELLQIGVDRIRAESPETLAGWVDALLAPAPTASEKSRTVLAKNIERYTKRNTFDYFIHKDLGKFLRQELDFYIKNEVMHLDDVERDTVPRVEQYLSLIKVIRRIAGKVIEFLAQLEDFQKKLWLKKKFVVETNYIVTLSTVPKPFYSEISSNVLQREEWSQLHNVEFDGASLSTHQSLAVDTRHFSQDFRDRLIASLASREDIDDIVDGVLFHSENFQALSLLQSKYKQQVDCIYIDPPYNTGSDNDFAYKDSYLHSSWLSMMQDRSALARTLGAPGGGMFVSTDDGEYANLRALLGKTWGEENFVADIIWNSRSSVSSDALISVSTNHTTFFAVDRATLDRSKHSFRLPENGSGFSNPDNDERGPWKLDPMDAPNVRANLSFEIVNPETGDVFFPPAGRCWRFEESTVLTLMAESRILFGRTGTGRPMYKRFLDEAQDRGRVATTLWTDVKTTTDATKSLLDMFGDSIPRSLIGALKPKPVELISRCATLLTNETGTVLDFFAGSGTTAHSVIALNRSDGGRRRFLLAEMGNYFDTVLVPRIKKAIYVPEWSGGGPSRAAEAPEIERGPRVIKYLRLESYEDTLNNLSMVRSEAQAALLSRAEAQGAGGLKEQYLLKYMLDTEARGSQSLVNIAAFDEPNNYELEIKKPGSDESARVAVDLVETFNWLLGLKVSAVSAPIRVSGEVVRDSEGRLVLSGRLREDSQSANWFRTVSGTSRSGQRVLVIWRNVPGAGDLAELEYDNLVLNEWFTKQGYSAADSEFDLIYVNGNNTLGNLRADHEHWKVRSTEEEFFRLMFDEGEL